jgi:hypothetical protein
MSIKFTNRTIAVSVGRTVGQPNYSSIKWSASITADIPDGADYQEAYDELFDMCTDQVEDYFDSCVKPVKPPTEEL